MKTCEKCTSEFPILVKIDGKTRNLGNRKFCLKCSPFGAHNTTRLTSEKPSEIVYNERLVSAVKESTSRKEVLNRLGFSSSRSAYAALNKRVADWNLDISHFTTGRQPRSWNKKELKDILVDGSAYNTRDLKRRLLRAGLLKELCGLCGLGPIWNEKPLVLQLDHKNGNRFDNRLENLRILCPNCHTQTATYGFKNGRGCRTRTYGIVCVKDAL